MMEPGHLKTVLIGLMIANGVLACLFGVLAKRSFRTRGHLTSLMGIWSGIAMHGHAIMTFAMSWIDRGSLYETRSATTVLGLVLMASGIASIAAGRRAYGDVARVYGLKEDMLIESGIYRWTRNPQYLGYYLLLLGSAVASGSAVAFLFVIIFIILIHAGVVLVEEPHLRQVFGGDYETYMQRVARYLGRRSIRTAQI